MYTTVSKYFTDQYSNYLKTVFKIALENNIQTRDYIYTTIWSKIPDSFKQTNSLIVI